MTEPKASAAAAKKIGDGSRPRWWGKFEIPLGHTGLWRIGPIALGATRRRNEWSVSRTLVGEATDTQCTFKLVEEPADAVTKSLTRYAAAGVSGGLELRPLLPDRSVITRPEHSIKILPRQKLTIYVGSPLWVQLEADEPLGELPLYPPKLTWWGKNTREGEICYASRTQGRLRLEDAALYPHRVTTAVLVHNDADTLLSFDRLNLPVRRLGVHASPNGRLWTESITLERAAGEEFAELKIDASEPRADDGFERISEPRDADREHLFFRAFGSLFG